jgi:hypothetical protein
VYFEPKHSVDVVISGGYRIVSYNHVIALNLNIFKIILLYNIGQAPSLITSDRSHNVLVI